MITLSDVMPRPVHNPISNLGMNHDKRREAFHTRRARALREDTVDVFTTRWSNARSSNQETSPTSMSWARASSLYEVAGGSALRAPSAVKYRGTDYTIDRSMDTGSMQSKRRERSELLDTRRKAELEADA
jgi:hypothetical protein